MYWCTSSSYYLTKRWGGRVEKLRKKKRIKKLFEKYKLRRMAFHENFSVSKRIKRKMWWMSFLGLRWIFNRVPQKNLIKVSSLDVWSWTARMSLQETNQQPSKTATKTICLSPPHTKHLRTCSENFLIKK